MSADSTIRDILAKYGEKHDKGTVWAVQGTPVILHKALERIAAKAGITFDVPQILRAERDEAVMLVVGHLPAPEGARTEWSVGEALVGANYRVSGKQAAYVWAMAEKRAKDRVILKLIGLHGLAYSEEEADQFKDERPRGKQAPADEPAAMSVAQMLHEIEICEGPADIEALKAEPAFRAGFKAAGKDDRAAVMAALTKASEGAAA
jgi:predicted secreted protein